MRNIVVYLPLPPYLRDYLQHHFGRPCRLPPAFPESLLLHRILEKQPRQRFDAPYRCTPPPECLALYLPDDNLHRPEAYNYLSVRALKRLQQSFDALFITALWTACLPLLTTEGGLLRGLQDWCRLNGIRVEHREAVRQKFYRMRLEYERYGIILGRKRSKRKKY